MTDLSIDLGEYLDKLSMEADADLPRDSLKMVVQLLMESAGDQRCPRGVQEGCRQGA